ncbi:sulfotransferase [Jannaschia sp. S6380]|uniref:sulfotransferase family protein n=1 Tax=Jannaschia sp. S6380 TaxID=2926408 RepID=UPI001FF3DA9F|nr:sulfotransferase [Jannaschia sp. S6380]MCK0168500.1 sulfotransferase [Jannaschia sp. S6380]
MNDASKPTATRLPDFIIGGAPKCGTTSLHFILGQHPDIGIPDNEINFFDADDPIVHPDFLFVEDGRLEWFDVEDPEGKSLDWYEARFAPFRDKPRIGEDTTTYLFSAAAPERIQAALPDVKMIFLLRDPVRRAYSQYWHLMRTARLACSFEKALTQHSSIVLGSTYAPHLRRYLDAFGPDQVKVQIFEDFRTDQQAFIDETTDYLDLPRMSLAEAKTWFNRSTYPQMPRLHRAANRIGRGLISGRYRNHMGGRTGLRHRVHHKLHHLWFHKVNPRLLRAERPPRMRADTAAYLAQHFSARNAGLSDLLGRDMSRVWDGFTG